jgi:hypothetical protein
MKKIRSDWIKHNPTQQDIDTLCKDGRNKLLSVGDEVAITKTGTVYSFSKQDFAKISSIEYYIVPPSVYTKVGYIECVLAFENRRVIKVPKQVLKLEQ